MVIDGGRLALESLGSSARRRRRRCSAQTAGSAPDCRSRRLAAGSTSASTLPRSSGTVPSPLLDAAAVRVAARAAARVVVEAAGHGSACRPIAELMQRALGVDGAARSGHLVVAAAADQAQQHQTKIAST